ATSAITIYNKDLFNKSGLLRLPKTYDELAAVAEKIKANTGAYAYLPTITENDTMLKIMNKYGISEISDYNSAKSIKLFNMFKKMYQNDLIPAESITLTHREALEQYMAGKIVFYQGGANFLNMIKENAPKIYEQTDVAEQIKGSVGQNDFSVMNFVIPLKAKNKQEALDFCLYLTNEENQLELAKMTNIITTNENALNDEFYNDKTDLVAKARSISAKQINRITPQVVQRRNQKEINFQINSAVQSALLNKDSVENLVESLYKNCEKLDVD
ncbi:MAG: extracellular solute-binding protein, partial [bacterium]|nr:extracellular solute-binding protein [bacterium]